MKYDRNKKLGVGYHVTDFGHSVNTSLLKVDRLMKDTGLLKVCESLKIVESIDFKKFSNVYSHHQTRKLTLEQLF